MVPFLTTLFCIITLIVSLILPIVMLIVYSARNRRQGIVSAWLLGAVGFIVPQFLIRLPIITALSSKSWFVEFSQNNSFLYAFALAFSAGLFELVGRFAVAKILKNKLTLKSSVAAGLGHGGIESILITGITYLNNLLYIVMINTGTLFTAVGPDAPDAIIEQLNTIQSAFMTTTPGIFLLAGFERILAMICHLAMSVIVCRGVYRGKSEKAVFICLAIHTLIDLTAGISLLIGNGLTQTVAYIIIYSVLVVAAALSIWIICRIKNRWKSEDIITDSE